MLKILRYFCFLFSDNFNSTKFERYFDLFDTQGIYSVKLGVHVCFRRIWKDNVYVVIFILYSVANFRLGTIISFHVMVFSCHPWSD